MAGVGLQVSLLNDAPEGGDAIPTSVHLHPNAAALRLHTSMVHMQTPVVQQLRPTSYPDVLNVVCASVCKPE
jgi:hypothetical protein